MKAYTGKFYKKGRGTKTTNLFFSPTTIQPMLSIGQPNDKYEQEADAKADQVMRMQSSGGPVAGSDLEEETLAPKIQTKCAACADQEKISTKPLIQKMDTMEEEGDMINSKRIQRMGDQEDEIHTKPMMMRKETGGGVATQTLTSKLSSTKGGGNPLPDATNQSMSQAFGTDFSHVRVHTNSDSEQMNQGIQARAFTHGSDIYFNKGEYRPESSDGQRLLAHELTHVVQQGGGRKIRRQPARQLRPPVTKTPVPRPHPPLRVIQGGLSQASRTAVRGSARRTGWKYFWRVVARKFAVRGSTAVALAAVDGPLPIGDLISLGLTLWMIWDLIQLWEVLWLEAHKEQEQEQSENEPAQDTQPLPSPSSASQSEEQNDCFNTNPYAIPCTDGAPDVDEAAALWLINNGYDFSDLGDCRGLGSFGPGEIDACYGAPGVRHHCRVNGKSFEISIFGCLCCDESGQTRHTWRGAHQSVNLSNRGR